MSKFSSIVIQQRSLDPNEAAQYVGGIGLLRSYLAAGWLKPYVQTHRLTRYDVRDLDLVIDRHKRENLPGEV